MRRTGLRNKVYPAVCVMGWVFGIVATLLVPISKVDTTKIPQNYLAASAFVKSIQDRIWWVVPAFGGFAGLCVFAQKKIGEPWVWNAICHVIETYRNYVFRG